MQRLVLAAVLMVASVLYVEPVVTRTLKGARQNTTVAQRYPLRSRSKNFYDRSKISYTRGK